LKSKSKVDLALSKGSDFFGPSPAIFVGRKGYPTVGVGPMAAVAEEESDIASMDDPRKWFLWGLEMEEIIGMRSSLLRSKRRENINVNVRRGWESSSESKFIVELQEIAMAERPPDVELKFKTKVALAPSSRISLSDVIHPMGPSVDVEKMKLAENPRIPRKVERIVCDDLKAGEAAEELYDIRSDVYKISAILSSGVLGREGNKKMVPTRWSITATDDIIFGKLATQVKEFPMVNSFCVYEASYMGNHFLILLMPALFEYENFEAWFPGSSWYEPARTCISSVPVILEEYESFKGRKRYAEAEGGGYYAARLAVIEALHKMRRQASVVMIREISPDYVIPLGVWVVRETVREAFRGDYEKFDTKKEAIAYIDSKLLPGTGIEIKNFIQRSKILRQKRLGDF
jgi:hypothetical protein